MQWYNEPADFSEQDGVYTITTKPKQDYWRETLHRFIKDDGHFYYQPVTGDFTAEVNFVGQYRDQYDQAGLMLRASETVWLKCGIELLDGVQQASTVVTREFSDWSIVPLAGSPERFWLRVKRMGAAVEVYFSVDGSDYTLMRQAYLTDVDTLDVGLMACSPAGEGFTTTFEGFRVETA